MCYGEGNRLLDVYKIYLNKRENKSEEKKTRENKK